jgi:hypothetical protein
MALKNPIEHRLHTFSHHYKVLLVGLSSRTCSKLIDDVSRSSSYVDGEQCYVMNIEELYLHYFYAALLEDKRPMVNASYILLQRDVTEFNATL